MEPPPKAPGSPLPAGTPTGSFEIPRVISRENPGIFISPTQPLSLVARIGIPMIQEAREESNRPVADNSIWDASQRAWAYTIITKEKEDLLRTLQGDEKKLDQLLTLAPFHFQAPQWHKPDLIVAYLLALVCTEENKDVERNLSGLQHVIIKYADKLPGLYLKHLYIRLAIKVYKIAFKTNFGISILNLSHALSREIKPPKLSLEFSISDRLTGVALNAYSQFLTVLLETSAQRSQYSEALKESAVVALRQLKVEIKRDATLLPFLLSFLPPANGKILDENDRPKIDHLCWQDIPTFDTFWDWGLNGYLEITPDEWLESILERSKNIWLNFLIIIVLTKFQKQQINREGRLLVLLNMLNFNDVNADNLNLFFLAFYDLKTLTKDQTKLKEWLDTHAEKIIVTAASVLDQSAPPHFFTIFKEVTLNCTISPFFGKILSKAFLNLDHINNPQQFFSDLMVIAEKQSYLFADVDPELYETMAQTMPERFSAEAVTTFLKTLAVLKRERISIYLSREASDHLLKGRPIDHELLSKLEIEWTQSECVSPIGVPKLSTRLHVPPDEQHENKASQKIDQNSGHSPAQTSSQGSRPTDG